MLDPDDNKKPEWDEKTRVLLEPTRWGAVEVLDPAGESASRGEGADRAPKPSNKEKDKDEHWPPQPPDQ